MFLIFQQVAYERPVNALANPLAKGKNVTAVARVTPTRVPAAGTNCAVTFLNVTGETLCTGYGTATPTGTMADGGVTCASSVDVCVPSSTNTCVNTWYVRDAVPDSLWYLAKTAADGGFGFRIEMGAGCQSP